MKKWFLIHSATNPDACHRGRKAVSPKGLKTVGLSLSVSTLSIPRINLENKPRCLPSGYTNVLISVIIFTMSFVVYSFAQEQAMPESIKETIQQTQQVSPEQTQGEVPEIPEAVPASIQEPQKDMNLVEIEGTIKKIAEDGSYIVVDETTVVSNSDLLAYSAVKEGDKVAILAVLTDEGIKAISINLADQELKEPSEASEQLGVDETKSEEESLEEALQEEEPKEEMPSQEESTENYPQNVIREIQTP